MKVTIPHMGNVYIAAKALFEGLGVDYVIPPLNSRAALEIGSLFPEEICLPFESWWAIIHLNGGRTVIVQALQIPFQGIPRCI